MKKSNNSYNMYLLFNGVSFIAIWIFGAIVQSSFCYDPMTTKLLIFLSIFTFIFISLAISLINSQDKKIKLFLSEKPKKLAVIYSYLEKDSKEQLLNRIINIVNDYPPHIFEKAYQCAILQKSSTNK